MYIYIYILRMADKDLRMVDKDLRMWIRICAYNFKSDLRMARIAG